MKTLFVIVCMTVTLTACTKKSLCQGKVYSKNNIAIPNIEVEIEVYNSTVKTKSYKTNTDKNGHYLMAQSFQKDRTYKFKCQCDSGSFHSAVLQWDQLSNVDITLQ